MSKVVCLFNKSARRNPRDMQISLFYPSVFTRQRVYALEVLLAEAVDLDCEKNEVRAN